MPLNLTAIDDLLNINKNIDTAIAELNRMSRSILREAERKHPISTIADNLVGSTEKIGRLMAKTHAACRELSNHDEAAASPSARLRL
jgi:hypothetical protein